MESERQSISLFTQVGPELKCQANRWLNSENSENYVFSKIMTSNIKKCLLFGEEGGKRSSTLKKMVWIGVIFLDKPPDNCSHDLLAIYFQNVGISRDKSLYFVLGGGSKIML